MLTTAQIRDELLCLTYRPGWSFEVYDGVWEGQHIVIRAKVIDAYHPAQTVDLDVHSMLPPMPDVAYLHRWLAWRLGRLEIHEMREWLHVDGVPVFDPHAEYADRDQS